jgi:hypothetical protein
MAEDILDRSVQSVLDECTQILEDTRALGSEDKWNDPLFSEDQEWVSNLDSLSASAAKRELAALESTLNAREDCTKFMPVALVELLEGGGAELITQLQQSNPGNTYSYLSAQLRDIQKLTQDTMGAEELPLKHMKEHIQSHYRRILLLARQNYTRLEETYDESRTLLRSLEVLRSQALEEDRDLEEREEA